MHGFYERVDAWMINECSKCMFWKSGCVENQKKKKKTWGMWVYVGKIRRIE